MFKFNLQDIKLGKNDNNDIGDNKNNKSKVTKNINNYDSNKVVIDLIKEIALKEIKISKDISVLKECKDCKDFVHSKIKKLIDIRSVKISNEKASNTYQEEVLKNITNITDDQYSETKIALLNFHYNNNCCDNHKQLLKDINLDRAEVESLNSSLKIYKNN